MTENKHPSLMSRIIEANLRLAGIKHRMSFQSYMKKLKQNGPVYPPAYIYNKYDIHFNTFRGRKVWRIRSKNASCEQKILYFHGGAYVVNFTMPHWLYMGTLAERLNAMVIAADYPLAPEHHVNDVFDMIVPLYQKVLKDSAASDLTLMGDSAGGGMALALAQVLREEKIEQPAQIMLLSPWLDVTMSNPQISQVDKKDPLLNVKGLIDSGKQYAGDLETRDPRVSPLYGSMAGLAPLTVFIGTHDVLLPDCRRLRLKAEKAGTPVSYYEYEGMLHDAMLYPIPEAKDIRDKIVKILQCSGEEKKKKKEVDK
ncbi:MAG: alpha/beta hydrolase [Candidatus Marinimicrobia bacterium]|nr:alpha/beta hydrolase [Candidatus Neomarinimicrobiota bacterium]